MSLDYGYGLSTHNLELADLRDLKIDDDVKIRRNHNKDYILRYRNEGNFVLAPASVQNHEHKTDFSELADIDQSVSATKTANDPTPFGLTWNRTTEKFEPYNIPRNLTEVLDSIIAGGVNEAPGTPNIIYFDSNVNKYRLKDVRDYLIPPESAKTKILCIPLHLKVTPNTTIMKTDNTLRRWINSGTWYASYFASGGPASLFYDTTSKKLGLKGTAEQAVLTLKTATQHIYGPTFRGDILVVIKV